MRKTHFYLFILTFILPVLILSSCGFSRFAKKRYSRAKAKGPYDAIIVPGYPYDSASGKWDDVLKIRVYWSYYLYKNGIAKNVIYSGSAVYTPYVEAKIMAMYGQALGIPHENIFIEDKAEHSTENIYYSYFMARKMGFEKIAIATDPTQAKLTKGFPKRKKLKVEFLPIQFDTLRAMNMIDPVIDAEKAKVQNFISIVERESKWKRFKGTLGWKLKSNKDDM